MKNKPYLEHVIGFFKSLQNNICNELQEIGDQSGLKTDSWCYPEGGGGITRIFRPGGVFEKGGVNFSHILGDQLPPSASVNRKEIAGKPFVATGVSLVMHPLNPFVPTCHMNVRFFMADPHSDNSVWWFGGGFDLTPYYGFEEDCIHWHNVAKTLCDKFDPEYYALMKAQCDTYFHIKHRKEQRGIGGLFFDDLNEKGFTDSFEFVKSVGAGLIDAYKPIVLRRKNTPFQQHHQDFQHYRRGRYVEFNLVYDRGTLFGLQSGGRTESILMSMPPNVSWQYDYRAEPGSNEEKLVDYFLVPRDWATS